MAHFAKTKPYTQYQGCPEIMQSADEKGRMRILRTLGECGDMTDLTAATLRDLREKLADGTRLSRKFHSSFKTEGDEAYDCPRASWVYYPLRKRVVRCVPSFWHRLALLLSNSTLLRDEALRMSWEEISEIFQRHVVAVAGVSVGSNAVRAVAGDMRPAYIKVADPKTFHISNANRVPIAFEDIGENKAVVTARQMHAIDPFMRISVYDMGVTDDNINDFVCGNKAIGEPPASVIIEEADDPSIKIAIRKKARAHGVPVVMVTDLGTAVQLDVRRFDKDDTLPLVYDVADDALLSAQKNFAMNIKDKAKFLELVAAFTGPHIMRVPALRRIVMREDEPLFDTVPQLGSTAMMAGGIAAGAVARIALGYQVPERVFFDRDARETITEGSTI